MSLSGLSQSLFRKVGIRTEEREKNKAHTVEGVPIESVTRISNAGLANLDEVIYGENHQPVAGSVGTFNSDMPPVFAAYMQKLRQYRGKESQENRDYFNTTLASLVELFMPLVFGEIYDIKEDLKVRFEKGSESFEIDYKDIFNGGLSTHGFKREGRNRVTTVSGVASVADVYKGLEDWTPTLIIPQTIKERLRNSQVAFVDVQRAATLPTIISDYIAREFGLNSIVTSVDAKRRGEEKGNGVEKIELLKPAGFEYSPHSSVFGNFVTDKSIKSMDDLAKSDAHVFFDPMLATGKSLRKVIEEYVLNVGCDYNDIYIVSLFAGGYDWQDELSGLIEKGVKIKILAHDQLDLNKFCYIVPGLGDAGDLQHGKNKILDIAGYQKMYESVERLRKNVSEKIYSAFNRQAMQITGKVLAR